MKYADIDYETFSDVDLKQHGLARYASDPSTKIICMAWALDGAEPELWWADEPMPRPLIDALNSDIPIYAHNAEFEKSISDYVLFEDFGFSIEPTRWRCTMVMALAHGLPAALGECAEAMGLDVQKQKHGARLIREYCGPNRLSEWKDGDKELMSEYCRYDVKVQQAIRSGLRPLTDHEWAEYHLNCKINDRGLPIDVEFVEAALDYADDIAAEVNGKIAELTGGMMTKHTQRKGRDAWLLPKLTEKQLKLLEVWKDGKQKISLDEEHRNALLEVEDLDPLARNLIELINDAGSAALKKYAAAANQHLDGRVHNTFLFHGAQTGRFCVAGETVVYSVNSPKYIKNVQVGEYVLTHTGKYQPVTSKFFKGYEMMYRVETEDGGFVECTANHKLLTTEGYKSVCEFEGFKERGCGETSVRLLSLGRASYYCTNAEDLWCELPHGVCDLESEFNARADRYAEEGKLFTLEERFEEPSVRFAIWKGEQAWELRCDVGPRKSQLSPDTSSGYHGEDGAERMARWVGGTPHRQQPRKQSSRQPSCGDQSWASAFTPSKVTKIEAVGERGVWDISVAGDHSYVGGGLIHHNSGRSIQPHNFRRDAFDNEKAEELIKDIKEGYEIEQPTVTMARLLRPMIYSPKGISYVDWSAIEGRVAPWLANSEAGEKKLDLYRAEKDVYVETAAGMFDQDAADLNARVDAGEKEAKGFRQAGKICELSLQYAGGKGALQGMAKNYGVVFEDEEAEKLVQLWRSANPWAEVVWWQFETACDQAVQHVGQPFEAARCTFQSDGNFLWCCLPSGRMLAYYRPKMEVYETPWGEERYGATFQTSTRVKVADREKLGKLYHRNFLRGGLMFQNAVQAIAADILRNTLVEADRAGLPVIGHVHDECIVEGDRVAGEMLNEIMLNPPAWAEGMPIATGGVEHAKRYGK